MDLLTLAETILRGRVTPEFTDTERALIDEDMTRDPAADLPWPEEPADEVETGIVAAEAEEIPAGVTIGEGDGLIEGALDMGLEETVASAEEATVVESPDMASEPAVDAAPESQVLEETETIPPFEGEQVEDSLGWVTTEPPQEYQYDWGEDAWAEEGIQPDADWDKDEEEEEEELIRPQKKKRKKRGRSRTDTDDESAYGVGRWR
jgi:hypothetical protein